MAEKALQSETRPPGLGQMGALSEALSKICHESCIMPCDCQQQ